MNILTLNICGIRESVKRLWIRRLRSSLQLKWWSTNVDWLTFLTHLLVISHRLHPSTDPTPLQLHPRTATPSAPPPLHRNRRTLHRCTAIVAPPLPEERRTTACLKKVAPLKQPKGLKNQQMKLKVEVNPKSASLWVEPAETVNPETDGLNPRNRETDPEKPKNRLIQKPNPTGFETRKPTRSVWLRFYPKTDPNRVLLTPSKFVQMAPGSYDNQTK
ncbi:hypothetical protein LXL04_004110 [Taraxacum kok-saghyz]